MAYNILGSFVQLDMDEKIRVQLNEPLVIILAQVDPNRYEK